MRPIELWHGPKLSPDAAGAIAVAAASQRWHTRLTCSHQQATTIDAVVAIDWVVIKSAALAGLFVLVPAIVVLTLVLDDTSASIWIYIFGLILVFGFLTAGYGAGRIRSDTPLIHGAIAGFACYVAIQLFGVISRLLRGDSINPWQYPFLAMFAASLGACGALFADWYRRKDART